GVGNLSRARAVGQDPRTLNAIPGTGPLRPRAWVHRTPAGQGACLEVIMIDPPDWFTESFRQEFDRQSHALGRVNLAIFGKTGVGKSTLINAIFVEEVARTGNGEPVTTGSDLYLDKVGQLGIVDTEGLEVGRDDKEIIKDLDKAINDMRKLPLSEQLHVAWY